MAPVNGIYHAIRTALDGDCPLELSIIRTSEVTAALKLNRQQMAVLGAAAQFWGYHMYKEVS